MRKPAHQTHSRLRKLKPERLDLLRGMALEKVLQLCGAEPDAFDPCKWHTARGALSVRGSKFFNWIQDQGGGGAIDLVMHIHRLNFKAAAKPLKERDV
jgi:hypothetical protein